VSQFLYFIPGNPRVFVPRAEVLATFAATALREQLRSDKTWNADSVVFNALPEHGPGGNVGTLFCCLPGGLITDEAFKPDYRAKEQTWIEINGSWLGWYTDNKPTEQSLRRAKTVSGYGVVLNDDCEWLAPTIRGYTAKRKLTLPEEITRGPNGARVVRIKPEFQRFQDLADKLWDFQFSKIELSIAQCCDAAAELLSLNYQIGPAEVDALGLFELVQNVDGGANWFAIITAAYDWPLIEELMGLEAEEIKKKESQREPSELSAGYVEETTPAGALGN
jgi:hypothetical protein